MMGLRGVASIIAEEAESVCSRDGSAMLLAAHLQRIVLRAEKSCRVFSRSRRHQRSFDSKTEIEESGIFSILSGVKNVRHA